MVKVTIGQTLLEVYEEAVRSSLCGKPIGLVKATSKFISAFEADFEASNFQLKEKEVPDPLSNEVAGFRQCRSNEN